MCYGNNIVIFLTVNSKASARSEQMASIIFLFKNVFMIVYLLWSIGNR